MLPLLVPISHITGMRPKATVASKLKLLSFHYYNGHDRLISKHRHIMTFLFTNDLFIPLKVQSTVLLTANHFFLNM